MQSQYINAGNIQNTGLELVLSATPIQKSNFNWNLEFNLASNKNKIIELTETVKSLQFLVQVSDDLLLSGTCREAVMVTWMGLYGEKMRKGRYLVTDAGLPLSTLTTGKDENIGNFNPKATLTYPTLSI
ncbi:MAG: hypothetical protein IPI77_23560 [Saprospiraceae bacterium]|nr:hypothetical protein [Saprospiraceae bacterium]